MEILKPQAPRKPATHLSLTLMGAALFFFRVEYVTCNSDFAISTMTTRIFT